MKQLRIITMCLMAACLALTSSAQEKTFLLIGTDSRQPNSSPGNSDMIMVLKIGDRDVKLASIMRDTYVDIPGKGHQKINAAYRIGGEDLLLQTIYSNFGLAIKHHIIVDFVNAPAAIDILGGIRMDITRLERIQLNKNVTEQNLSNPHHYPLLKYYGKNILLDGGQCLAYSRIRIDGDRQRTSRQQQLITSCLKGLKKTGGWRKTLFLERFWRSDYPFAMFYDLGMKYVEKKASDPTIHLYPISKTFPMNNYYAKTIDGIEYLMTDNHKMGKDLRYFFQDNPHVKYN